MLYEHLKKERFLKQKTQNKLYKIEIIEIMLHLKLLLQHLLKE